MSYFRPFFCKINVNNQWNKKCLFWQTCSHSPCSAATWRKNPHRCLRCCWFPWRGWAWRWPAAGAGGQRAWRCLHPRPPCWRRHPPPPAAAPSRCAPASLPAAAASGCGCSWCWCRSVPGGVRLARFTGPVNLLVPSLQPPAHLFDEDVSHVLMVVESSQV